MTRQLKKRWSLQAEIDARLAGLGPEEERKLVKRYAAKPINKKLYRKVRVKV